MLKGKVVDPANLPSQLDGASLDDLDVLSDFDIDEGSADDEVTLASERSSGNLSKDMAHLSLPQSAIALTSVIDSEADITEESIDFVEDDLTGAATPSEAGRAHGKPATSAKEVVDTNQAILFAGIAHRTYVPFRSRLTCSLPTLACVSVLQLASPSLLYIHRHRRVRPPQQWRGGRAGGLHR